MNSIYVGFWARLVATFIDFIWISLFIVLLTQLYNGYVDFSPHTWQANLFNNVLPALFTFLFWIRYSATPGKQLIDCKIIHAETGEPISASQSFLRYAGYIVSTMGLGIGFLWIAIDSRKQGWHDKIANTIVVPHDESSVPLSQLVEECC